MKTPLVRLRKHLLASRAPFPDEKFKFKLVAQISQFQQCIFQINGVTLTLLQEINYVFKGFLKLQLCQSKN